MYADYFLTLAKDPTAGGQSLLVVPKVNGVETRHMVMSGSSSAGTAFVEFDDMEVPTENIVGERGKAFKYIVSNFNHEVGTTCSAVLSILNSVAWMVLNDSSRGSLSRFNPSVPRECALRTQPSKYSPPRSMHGDIVLWIDYLRINLLSHRYALTRETFGKRLIDHRKPGLPYLLLPMTNSSQP